MAVTIESPRDCDPDCLTQIAQSCGVQLDQIEDVYQCTATQLGILADSAKQTGLYTYRGIANLRQDVNVESYLEALRHVVSLNPILRTRFVDTPVGILQAVIREAHVTEQPRGTLEDYLSSDRARATTLSQPLFRTALVSGKLVLTIHHSIGDQYGNLAFLRDVSHVYHGCDPEVHAPYKDFVQHCLSIDRNEAVSFWAPRLQSPAVHFPACDPTRVPNITQHVTKTIPLDLRNGEVSLALIPSYIESAWALTARSYTGSDHVAYGMVFSGRTANSWETTLGPTLVTIPVLVSVKGSNSIRELLQERSKQRRQVQSHPALQYGIAQIRQISSEARAACEFQSLLNIRPVGDQDAEIRELTFHSKEEVVGPYGINLTCTLTAQSLLLEASSDPDVLDDMQLQRILGQFQHCLNWLLRSSPHAKVDRLPLLNAEDSASILKWNADVPGFIENTLHGLMASQASAQPDRLAVEACDGDLTYGELETFSERLCNELRYLGMSPQDAVGFVFEKSRWAIVAILAIMRAGGACVPIDPSHPLARKQQTLSLTKARFVLVSNSLDISQDDVGDVFVVQVSAEALSHMGRRPALPEVQVSPDSPAYIMPTSGSTGTPKGVVLEHRCLVSSLTRLIPHLRLGNDSRALQFAAYIWDASLLEIFGTVLAGGCVVVPSDRDRESRLAEFISSHQATWALLTPAVLRTLSSEHVPSLRTLITGGEAMDASAAENWSRSLQFFNAYGPCEASIISAVDRVELDSSHPGSIGRPVGCAAWIVHPDRPEVLLPVGATGELVVQGPNVARGYLHDPVKTSAAFLRPLPQSLQRQVSPHHMYRTGDLVKYNSDGSICFVGRRDQQVKLRGQRFELGEVEAALLKCPEVNEIAAEIVQASSGRKELVAVISIRDQVSPSGRALKILPTTSEQVERRKSQVAAFARSVLPSHMVPTLFLAVEALPKSKSLKLDRSAIRAWVREQSLEPSKASESQLRITAPVSPQECALQATWSSVLGIDGSMIGRESSFIALGGDSISGMQVATRLRKDGFHITVPKLLASDSLAAAAIHTESIAKDAARSHPIAVEVPESSALSPIQALYFNQDGPASDSHFNHLWVLHLQVEISVSRLQEALERLVSHHATLRARMFLSPSGWRQKIEPDVKSSWSFHHTSAVNGDQIDHEIRRLSNVFDLQKGPVFAAHLVEQSSSSSLLVLAAHHMVVDLVSWRIIWEDLEAILRNPAAELIESVPFLSWTIRQTEDNTAGSSLAWPKADLGFWQLEEKTAMNKDLIRHTFTLERDKTTAIMGASNRAFNTTPTELLLASVVKSFQSVFPDRSWPAIFFEGHGRNANADSGLDVSRTVGWFTTLSPLNLPSDIVLSTEITIAAVKDFYRQDTTKSAASFSAAVNGDPPFTWRDLEILFNFAGNMQPSKRDGDDIFQLDSRYFDSVFQTSDNIPPTSLISISALMQDGELVFLVEYNKLMAHQDRLHQFVGVMESSLKGFATTLPMQKTRLSLHEMKLLRASYQDLPRIHDRLSAIGIETSNVESILPCTPMQEGMLLARVKNQNSVYISRFIFGLTARDGIDTIRLEGAWRSLCGSHSILRTVLASAVHFSGAFQQIVLRHTDPLVSVLDVPLDQDQDQNVLSTMRDHSSSEFPTSLPRHRVLLARVSETKAYMMIEIDHALTDARSMQLMALQLHIIYCGTPAIPKKLEFADHVAFLQENRQKSLEHWISYLDGAQLCTLPRRQTGVPTVSEINSVTVPLQPPQDLFSFCKSQNVTVANVIQLAWGLVLRQLTGSSDPFFGVLISGRDSSEDASFTLGPFINMLICRVNMIQESTVSGALQTVKQDLARGMDNAACALNDIQDRLGHGSSALFETAVSVQHSWTEQLVRDEVLDIQLEYAEDPTEFAMTVNVMYTDTSIQCKLFYHSTRLSNDSAKEIAGAYARIIHAIVADGRQPIEDLLCTNGLPVPKPFSLVGDLDKSRLKRQASMQCEVSTTCIDDILPLTPLQDEIITSAIDDHTDHFVHSAFRTGPNVSLDTLCESWDIVVAASPALRTRIVSLPEHGKFQVILKETPMWLENSSISEYMECSRNLAVRHGGRLVRFARIEDEAGDDAVVISFHRSICDEVTFARTARLAHQAYSGESIRCMGSMAALIASVGDKVEQARSFWTSKLKRHTDATAFPNFGSESGPRSVIVESSQIRTPGSSQGDTAAVLHAAWALCLSRLTANQTVSFGVTVDSQTPSIPGRKDISGLTTTTIPCVVTLPASGRPRVAVDQVKQYVAQAIPYAHTSRRTIESVCQGATEYHNTLQVIFTDAVSAAESSSLMDQIPLTEDMYQDHGKLTVSCMVQGSTTMLQMRGTMSREMLMLMLQQYEHAIAQFDTSMEHVPDLSVLEPLSRYETSLLQSWNQEPVVAVEQCVHALIRKITNDRPQSCAVCSWDRELNYERLDTYASRLARLLQEAGAEPEVIVPFLCEKSALAPVIMLGILQSGSAMLPMEPSHPTSRLKDIAKDAEASIIVCSPRFRDKASALATTVIEIDFDQLDRLGDDSVEDEATPSNACYVIYTSGSTGKPKGIIVEHRSVATSILSHMAPLSIDADLRMLQIGSFAFDAAVAETLFPLLVGGCICVPSDNQRQNDIAGAINATAANFSFMTPSLARLISPSAVPTLRTLALMGEPTTKEDLDLWCHATTRLICAYGPAEGAIISSCSDVMDSPRSDFSKIGYPHGCRMWVTSPDDLNRLAPIGSPGILIIQGPAVARGYIKDPLTTAACFISPPTWAQHFPTARTSGGFYNTGDLVVQNADGSVSFVGRKDNQIKVRGQRVEIGEVEYNLKKLLDSSTSVAVEAIRTSHVQTDVRLMAFVSTASGDNGRLEQRTDAAIQALPPTPDKAAILRKELLTAVASYMVPDIYIPLQNLPLSHSGKLDRRRLREFASAMSHEALSRYSAFAAQAPPQPPQPSAQKLSGTERALQQLWSRVLSIPETSISAEDHFMALGGNSIKAIQLVSAARQQGVDLTVVDIFQHPVLADLAQTIGSPGVKPVEISPFSLLSESVDAVAARQHAAILCNVSQGQIEDMFPATAMQQGLLAMASKRPGDYVAQLAFELGPDVDVDMLKRAWERVAAAAPILRTRILDVPGHGLLQVVVREPTSWGEYKDLQTDMIAERQREMTLGSDLSHVGLHFDAETGRITFVWTLHHAIYDGWSMSLLLDAIETAYKSQTPRLAPFGAFIKHLQAQKPREAADYWTSQFANLEASQFPPLPSPDHVVRADESLEHRLAGLQLGTSTLSTVLRSSWALLLAAYSGNSDVVFGAVVSGRQANVADIEYVAGPTLATVPVRVTVNHEQTGAELLSQVQRQTLEMIAYEQTGLHVIRSASAEAELACGFQSLLLVQPEASSAPAAAGGLFAGLKKGQDAAKDFEAFSTYAIVLECEPRQGDLYLRFALDSKVVSREQVVRMAYQLEHILRQLSRQEVISGSLKQMSMVPAEDLQEIWSHNATVPVAVDEPVHEMISAVARKQPDAPAIHAWDGDLTYGALDNMSTTLARHLVRHFGVGPEMIVPLLFFKSMWTSVAALAVMKAGRASLFLDMTQPKERHAGVVRESKATLLICASGLEALASSIAPGLSVIMLDWKLFDELEEQRLFVELPHVQPHNALYVVFTSGSTGTPKGAVIEHGNFASAIHHQRQKLGLSPSSRVFDLSAYAFDMAWYNILHTFANGACLCVPSDAQRKDDVSGAVFLLNPNFVCATPTFLSLLSDEALQYFDTIEVAGEVCPQDFFTRLAEAKKSPTNAFGPAECTAIVTSTTSGMKSPFDIGKGCGAVTWLVDPTNPAQLVPFGCVGEVWIEGPLVGRGYLGRPEQTNSAFIENPPWLLEGRPGHAGRRGRLYRTGDLARYESDGRLRYLGRRDAQVKIRGQRVELGEVEQQIRAVWRTRGGRKPDLQVVAETAKSNNDAASSLVVCLAPAAGTSVDEERLKKMVSKAVHGLEEGLAELLPQYMIPSAYIALPEIPKTPSGKTDRKRLRELVGMAATERLHSTQSYSPPTNELEERMQAIWSDVLNLPVTSISVDTKFARLGDSIQAMQVVAKCRRKQMDITTAALLEAQGIRGLCLGLIAAQSPSGPVTAKRAEVQAADMLDLRFGLSPIQQWFFEMQTPDVCFDVPLLMRLQRSTTFPRVQRAMETLVARHSMFRARFERAPSGEWVQYIQGDVESSFHAASVACHDWAEVGRMVRATRERLDMQRGPLIAVTLIDLPDGEQLLFVTSHHLVVDYVSWRVLTAELDDLLSGRVLPPQQSTSFQRWSLAQAQHTREHLHPDAALPPGTHLAPPDLDFYHLTASAIRERRYAEHTLTLDGPTTSRILAATGADVSPFELLLSTLLHSFHLAFPTRALPAVFCEGHGREPWPGSDLDVSQTIGWFTTTFPVQLHASQCTWPAATLRSVAQAYRALPNRGFDYCSTRYLHPTVQHLRSASNAGVCELNFNFLGTFYQFEHAESLFRLVPLPEGSEPESAQGYRPVAVFDIVAYIVEGQLRVVFKYACDGVFVDRLSGSFRETIGKAMDAGVF